MKEKQKERCESSYLWDTQRDSETSVVNIKITWPNIQALSLGKKHSYKAFIMNSLFQSEDDRNCVVQGGILKGCGSLQQPACGKPSLPWLYREIIFLFLLFFALSSEE